MFTGRRFLSALLALSSVHAASSPESHGSGKSPKPSKMVEGKVFDRFAIVWLENTNFVASAADPNFAAIIKQGISLQNYFSVTHPSEPNYVAAVGAEYFGMDNDDLTNIPSNISTVVDLLDTKGISWAEYQEDMPSTGFEGFQFLNPTSGANDYVRKHNPLIIYDSVVDIPQRSANIKNFTLLNQDLANNNIPQWMFITPNMTNDGHDTNITFSAKFTKNFLEPLLSNPNFNGKKTLILLTFDEDGGSPQNRISAVLLGNAVPKHLAGTTDSNFYNHYSEIATVSANWDLPTLGRYDVGANVFEIVGQHTGDKIRTLQNPPLDQTFLNGSYPGVFNSETFAPLPIPNTKLVVNGRRVLDSIVKTWGSPALQKCTVYTGALEIPSQMTPPVLPAGCT